MPLTLKRLLDVLLMVAAWFFDPYRQLAKRREKTEDQKRTIAEEVHKGNEDAVNKRINDLLRCVALAAVLGLTGCARTTMCYVPEPEKVTRITVDGRPGWFVPDVTLERMLLALEKCKREHAGGQ